MYDTEEEKTPLYRARFGGEKGGAHANDDLYDPEKGNLLSADYDDYILDINSPSNDKKHKELERRERLQKTISDYQLKYFKPSHAPARHLEPEVTRKFSDIYSFYQNIDAVTDDE